MSDRSTWWHMERFNLPVSGSKIRLHNHLDTYGGGKGDVIWVGWSPRAADVHISNEDKTAGTHCRMTQFERCEWEYVYDTLDDAKKSWPRAEYKGPYA